MAIGCFDGTEKLPIETLSLEDLGQELNGHWKLTVTENKNGQRVTNPDPDKFEYYEFVGIKGMSSEVRDNHNGTYSIPTCQPVCELKEQGSKKIIEYIGLGSSWEREIEVLSERKLVLADSNKKWIYERKKIKGW